MLANMEAFKRASDLKDLYELNNPDDIKMQCVKEEIENPHDVTDDALETILMEEEQSSTPLRVSIAGSAAALTSTTSSALCFTENKSGLTQPVQLFTQQKVGNPVVTRLVVKTPVTLKPTSTAPPSVGFSGINASAPGISVQAPKLQAGNRTFMSPVKDIFKIPISPAKNTLKVSVVASSSSMPPNTIKTVNLNSSLLSSNAQAQSKFQFQTLIPAALNTVTVGVSDHVKLQQQSIPAAQMGNQRTSYLRIVPATNGQNASVANIATVVQGQTSTPVVVAPSVVQQQKIQPFVNVQTPQRPAVNQVKSPRLIMPATTVNQAPIAGLTQGTVLPAGNVGYAMIPARYVEQLKKQLNNQLLYGTDSTVRVSPETSSQANIITKASVNGKVRKPCNCTKSMCLKLYCECFANGHFCDGCNCVNCHNNLEFDSERSKAIKSCLERNPQAFRPKIGRGLDDNRTHQKGCNCKRSGCLKNYCECYEARIPCTSKCKCIGCKNLEDDHGARGEKHSLMHLADAAAVRCQQQAAAQSKISSQIGEMRLSHIRPQHPPSGERLPSTFFTQEVIEATCTCMLAQAEEAEKTNRSTAVAEMMILEEFGRCLMQIIQAAGKAKTNSRPT